MEEKQIGYLFGVSKASASRQQLEAMVQGKSQTYQDGAFEGWEWAQSQDVVPGADTDADTDSMGRGGTTDRPTFGGADRGGDNSNTAFGHDDAPTDVPMDFGDSANTQTIMQKNKIDDEQTNAAPGDMEIVEEDNEYKIARRYSKADLEEAKADLEEGKGKKRLKEDGDDVLIVEDDTDLDFSDADFALSSADVSMTDSRRPRLLRTKNTPARRSILQEALGEMDEAEKKSAEKKSAERNRDQKENISDGYVTDLEEKAATAAQKTLGDKVAAQVDAKGYAISRKSGMLVVSKEWAGANAKSCVRGVAELIGTAGAGITFDEPTLSAFLSEALDVDGHIAALQIDAQALKTAAAKLLGTAIRVETIK